MGKSTCYIRRYVCDNGIEYKTKFYVKEDISEVKSYRQKNAIIRRYEKGAAEAAHEMGRLLNCNFKTGKDYYLGLDYSDEGLAALVERMGGIDDEQALVLAAKKEWENYLRRVKRRCAKLNIDVRAVDIVSISDPETGEVVRIHHHAVVNAEAVEIFKACWKAGQVWAKKLRSKHGVDLQDLANYMIKQAARVGADKRYTHTRNLVKAIAHPPVQSRNPDAELRAPIGCEMIWRSEYTKGRAQHIRYYRPPGHEAEEKGAE